MAARLEEIGFDAATAQQRADVLSKVLSDDFGFVGDRKMNDSPANADLIGILDRRRGLPVSPSILYAAAHRLGWMMNVLDVPGRALVLIGEEAAPLIVEPCDPCQAPAQPGHAGRTRMQR